MTLLRAHPKTCVRLAPKPTGRSPWASALVAQMVVFVWFGPYLANLNTEWSRYNYFWRASDTGYVLACLLLIALPAWLLGELVYRLGRPMLSRVFNHLFVLVLGAGLINNVVFVSSRLGPFALKRAGLAVQMAYVLLAALVAYSFARRGSRLVSRCRTACLVFSPAMATVIVRLLTLPGYPQALEPLPTPAPRVIPAAISTEPARPVYMFIFDEWSYEHSYENGRLRPFFANLQALSRQSIVFHDAHAPGTKTEESLPRLLFQTDLPVVVDQGRTGFQREGRFVPSYELPSIFCAARELGYHSLLIGFSLPYRHWLRDQAEVCRSYCYYQRGDDVLSHLAVHTRNALHYCADPWLRRPIKRLEGQAIYSVVLGLYRETKRDMLRVIREQPANTFTLCHFHCPHPPYILNEDGSYRSPEQTVWLPSSVEGYQANLAGLDAIIGELVTAMKDAGRFDEALIIMTSDHSWRDDPSRCSGKTAAPVTHVPLIVKLSGQDQARQVTARFETRFLGTLIAAALQAGNPPERMADLLPLQAVVRETGSETPAIARYPG